RQAFAGVGPQPARAHLPPRSLAEVAGLGGGEGDAVEPVHPEAEMFADALDLAVLALAQAERQPDVVALLALEPRLHGAVVHALDGDAVGETVECRLVRLAIGADAIATLPPRVGMGEDTRAAAGAGAPRQPHGIAGQTDA